MPWVLPVEKKVTSGTDCLPKDSVVYRREANYKMVCDSEGATPTTVCACAPVPPCLRYTACVNVRVVAGASAGTEPDSGPCKPAVGQGRRVGRGDAR